MKRMNLSVLVLVAAMAGLAVADTWHFKGQSQLGNPAASSSATLSWEDPNNWEEGMAPVDDAVNTDIVIQMDQGDGTVPSVFSALPQGWYLCNVGGILRLSYSNGLTIIFR